MLIRYEVISNVLSLTTPHIFLKQNHLPMLIPRRESIYPFLSLGCQVAKMCIRIAASYMVWALPLGWEDICGIGHFKLKKGL